MFWVLLRPQKLFRLRKRHVKTQSNNREREAEKMTPTLSTPKTFLESYEEYTYDIIDAPEIYNHMLGLGLIAHAVGRTPLNIDPSGTYPNLYITLLGAPGKTRKSNTQKIAKNILPPNQRDALPQSFSPEGLQTALSDHPQGSMFIEEIAGLLESIHKRDYMAGTADLLCEIYDCPEHYSRRLKNIQLKLEDVCVNIVSATTPTRFLENVKASDFSSGFMARFLIVWGIKSRRLPRWTPKPSVSKRREMLEALWLRLYEFFHASGAKLMFEFEELALILLDEWCAAKDAETEAIIDVREQDLKSAIYGRMQEYAYKLSALFEADRVSSLLVGKTTKGNKVNKVTGNNPQKIMISLESAHKALNTLDELLTLLTVNLLPLLIHSPQSNIESKLEKLITIIKTKADSDGWIQHKIALQHTHFTADELKTLIDTAQQRDIIESKIMGQGTYYRIKPASTTEETQPPTPQTPKTKEMFSWCKVFRQTNPISANMESPIPEKEYAPLVFCEIAKEREEISMKGRINHE